MYILFIFVDIRRNNYLVGNICPVFKYFFIVFKISMKDLPGGAGGRMGAGAGKFGVGQCVAVTTASAPGESETVLSGDFRQRLDTLKSDLLVCAAWLLVAVILFGAVKICLYSRKSGAMHHALPQPTDY